jgi:hypothetical protein
MSDSVLEAKRAKRSELAFESLENAKFRAFPSAIVEEVDEYLKNLLSLAGNLDNEFKTSQLSRRMSELSQDLLNSRETLR